MSTKPKPVKPRRMWAYYSDADDDLAFLSSKHHREHDRPVLVIDLSPESVEALTSKLADYYGSTASGAEFRSYFRRIDMQCARESLAAIGIRPSRRKGSK